VQVELPALHGARAQQQAVKRVVVLSFDGQPAGLLQELAEFGPAGSEITVVVEGEGGAPAGWVCPRGYSVRWAAVPRRVLKGGGGARAGRGQGGAGTF
jgi:hypothetical protein